MMALAKPNPIVIPMMIVIIMIAKDVVLANA
jgi:hypothetical protein